ncbi:hypothetical protein KDK77_02185 [bacterium]|nr:hypothetical protein [bacterium]MCP5462836.1 hypothetical protein [bacterium]
MKITLFGFGAFPGIPVNFTGQLVHDVSSFSNSYPVSLESFVLPVVFETCGQFVRSYIETSSPDFVIIAGIKRKSTEINLERVALNILHSYGTDASGKIIRDCFISPKGKEAFFCPLDLSALESVLTANNIPSRVTFHSGTYVCNQAYYSACSIMHEKTGSPSALLVHYPMVADENPLPVSATGMRHSDAVCALRLIIQFVCAVYGIQEA